MCFISDTNCYFVRSILRYFNPKMVDKKKKQGYNKCVWSITQTWNKLLGYRHSTDPNNANVILSQFFCSFGCLTTAWGSMDYHFVFFCPVRRPFWSHKKAPFAARNINYSTLIIPVQKNPVSIQLIYVCTTQKTSHLGGIKGISITLTSKINDPTIISKLT